MIDTGIVPRVFLEKTEEGEWFDEFETKIIHQTPGYWHEPMVRTIHDLLTGDRIINPYTLVQLTQEFFTTFFNRMLWHNRGAA